MGFFQHRVPAEDFQDSQADQADLACQEDQGDQGFRVEPPEAFKRRRLLHRNSCRKCRLPHLPLIPAGSDAACSATHTFG